MTIINSQPRLDTCMLPGFKGACVISFAVVCAERMDVCWWRARFALLLSSVIKGTRKKVRKKSTYGTNKRRVLSHGGSGKCEIQHSSTFKTSTVFKQHGVSMRFVSTESLEVALAIVLPLLLILAGDVELNPGPTQKGGDFS